MIRSILLCALPSLVLACSGCPGNTPDPAPIPTPTATVTVPDPQPSSTVPELDAGPPESDAGPLLNEIGWMSTESEAFVNLVSRDDFCFIIYFKSDDNERNKVIDDVLSNQSVVNNVNKSFYAAKFGGAMSIRENEFGIDRETAGLLMMSNNNFYAFFNPFNVQSSISIDELVLNLNKGLTHEQFSDCEAIKNK